VGSALTARRFARLAQSASNAAVAEHSARTEAEAARLAAQAETYGAMLSESKALRAGRQLGWRDEALANLARLAVMPTPRRDLVELRTEAVACVGEFGVKEVARFEVSGVTAGTLEFSPDSRTLAAATDLGNLDLWDVAGRKPLHQHIGIIRRHRNLARESNGGAARFLADGNLAFLGAGRQVTYLGATGRPSARPEIEREKVSPIKLGVDRQGRWLAVGWEDGRVDLHDARTGELRRSLDPGPSDFVISPDGHWLAVQPRDGPIQVVPTEGQGPSFTLGRGNGFFPALAFSPDGATIASVDGRKVVLWDVASKQESLTLSGHKESVTAIAFSPDGTLVATACGDSMTRIWDARDGRLLAALPGPWYMRSLAFSPDGEYLAAGADPGPVCLYQLEGRREQRRLVGHKFGSLSVAFHPRLPRLVSSSDDHFLIVWDPDTARPLLRWDVNPGEKGLAYSPDGSLLASSRGGAENFGVSIVLWNATDGTERRPLRGHQSEVKALAFDAPGRRLASGDKGGSVLLWGVDDGRILRREEGGNSPVASIAFLDRDRRLLVGWESGDVALFDLEMPGPPRRIHLPAGCLRFVIDGRRKRAIVGDASGAVIALSLTDLAVVHRLARGHEGAIQALAMSPDGRFLATSGRDRRVILRDASTFEALLTFPGWTGVVRGLAFDASGRWLALAGVDSDVSLWDLGLVHDELTGLGLAWDQPAPSVVPASIVPLEERASSRGGAGVP
jgi:WD40 repeat protein